MFEDFSFSLSTRLDADEDRVMADSDSSLVSPLSSRCPSPRSFYRLPQKPASRSRSSFFRPTQQPPTSVPSPYDKRLSITTLTRKLHEHTLNNPEIVEDQPLSPTTDVIHTPAKFPGYFLTPPDTDQDDEGFYDSSSITSSQPSTPQSPFLCPTSVPPEYQLSDRSRELSPISASVAFPDKQSVRTKRQQISRFQCGANTAIDAVRRAMEEEALEVDTLGEDECHPNSLPPQLSPRRKSKRSRSRPAGVYELSIPEPGTYELTVSESRSRRTSSSYAPSSHRIDKSYGRDLRKRSEQGLRRKSLVSAALASVVERSHSPA
ncbi:hypothetical protein MAP00_001178 [Monascus purpureus]|nr:hypothetical protein MAP00_001178 [Monascus purpureus]